MLRPKQTKFRKWRKYQIKTIEAHNVGVKFGSFGLQALEGSHITAHQTQSKFLAKSNQLLVIND